jgi:hypothetical protein
MRLMSEPGVVAVASASSEPAGPLTAASGFFFERDDRLFVVTSRHVLIDEPSDHFPDRIEIELHADAYNLTRSLRQSSTGMARPSGARDAMPVARSTWR